MRYMMSCALNGTELYDLDERIYIEDILEKTELDHETANRAHYGMLPLNTPRHKSIEVTVRFMVKEKRRAERSEVISKVTAWATEGWLTTNVRPDRRLYVFCTEKPEIETFDWTARMEVHFTAYGEAYWQSTQPKTFNSSQHPVNADRKVITPEGTQDCFLEAEITPSGNTTLTSVSIAAGGQTLALSGLSVTGAAPLVIRYDELHLLHIESGETSLLGKRSAESADDIILPAGQASVVALTFSCNCTYKIFARGLWK